MTHVKLCQKRVTYSELDDLEEYEGLPVGIQLVGPTLQEEIVLGIGEVVNAALKATREA